MGTRKQNFLQAVVELCRVRDEQIAGAMGNLSQHQLVETFILPYAVQVGGQDTRGWRLGPDFMQFMAEWGKDCVLKDRFTGELLMELGMQRLSKGAIVHEPGNSYHLINVLPEQYRKYTSAYDQPGLMGEEEWLFYKENISYIVSNMQNPTWQAHATMLIWGLLTHLTPEGEPVDSFLFNEKIVKSATPSEVWWFTAETAVALYGLGAVAKKLLPNWRLYKSFFKKNEDRVKAELDNGLAKELNIEAEAECYFGKWKRRFLKLTGNLDNAVINAVKAEMFG